MLGDNIRKYRKASGMSQDDLAEQLDVTRQSISLWENNQTQPTLDNIVALAGLFHISIDELISGEKMEEPMNYSDNVPTEAPVTQKKSKTGIIIAVALIVAAILITLTVSKMNNRRTTDNITPTDTPPTEIPPAETEFYKYFKNYVAQNGVVNGDYCYIADGLDYYDSEAEGSFSLYYWGDTDTLEFGLRYVLDEDMSICFRLYIPPTLTGVYDYSVSYYFRDNGENYAYAEGTIDAAEFSQSFPLRSTSYTGPDEIQSDFMETGRRGMCNLLALLKKFLYNERSPYTFRDMGFQNEFSYAE